VAGFLDELARRLVPACDPEVVRSVFETASAGYSGPRTRDGRRVSVLTPSGVPFEASVTGGEGRPVTALRYLTEPGTTLSFFAPRLSAQRAALAELVQWMPEGGRSAGAELQSFIDAVFPDPGAVPARTRFATFFGLVHQPQAPSHLSWLKLYANLAWDRTVTKRLSERWQQFAALVGFVDGLALLAPQTAALEVSGSGERRYKLYFRPGVAADRGAVDVGAASVRSLARRFGADTTELRAELTRWNVEINRWPKVHICCEVRDGVDPALSIYLPMKALGLDPDGMATLARNVAQCHHGTTEAVDALSVAAAATPGAGWHHSVVGVGLRPGGRIGKFNVYFAPDALLPL
jgi:hypothetical protein